jgi:2-haloacid dehalogenase
LRPKRDSDGVATAVLFSTSADVSEFDSFRVLSFDCYGTLIDWEAGMTRALRGWADAAGLAVSDRHLLNLVSEVETVVQGERSPALLYPAVLAEVLRRIGARLGAPVSDEEAARFGGSIGEWPAFADSAPALSRLGRRFRLIILSNVDRASFAASSQRLGVNFDKIITAEDVGAYKPRSPHFEALLESLTAMSLDRHQLLHVAQSLYHDHEPARRYGLSSVWIDRGRGRLEPGATPPPGDPAIEPEWRFPTLEAFADAVLSPL